ncbi:hypothetical protein COU75_03140 [Candidatus Peregrinibacteria bacterium CG10_big_fil_rev_8_21_14_0_10_42_8]|nr:MAG: hypothetical protein COU75_03140 [Candidatus Peregrinibacteria bacterium CG10_big_fil_rev_8_21_14_0_10_42_8]
MKDLLQSPWLTVTLAIVVMTIGYVMFINKDGSIASAGVYSCPASACASEECMSDNCPFADKCKHCPGCNKAS